MYTRDDILDAVRRHLTPQGPAALQASSPGRSDGKIARIPSIKGRPFLTEYEIKKALTPGTQHLKIPKDAIVSPLAQDWLVLGGIRIVRF